MKHLVLVAGHAIPHRFDRLESDDGWFLKFFQAGEGKHYLDHVRRGVEIAAEDPQALLVFAGGQTDEAAGPRSEGQGYWLIAEHSGWYGFPDVRKRSTTEEFSVDSFLNLLYGLCRFREFTGKWPERITAVGWKFKGERFGQHREAIHWPESRYRYEGVNDPPELEKNLPFEASRRELFKADPYGTSPEPLAKKTARNVFHRVPGYAISCPELAELLEWKGPELFPGPLPWPDR